MTERSVPTDRYRRSGVFIVGDQERQAETSRNVRHELRRRGVECTLDMRIGLGHVFPADPPDTLPNVLEDLTAN